jgi:acyl-CoA reductase-like NAD-dependent aldehyde dehydrogenase
VLGVSVVETENEAIALANNTLYGPAATVWTKDAGLGRRMAGAIRAGRVSVRTSGSEPPDSGFLIGSEPQKASGFGAEDGLHGLHPYSTLKFVEFKGD